MTLLQDFCSRRLRCHCQEIERRRSRGRAREQVLPPKAPSLTLCCRDSFLWPLRAFPSLPPSILPSFFLLENCLLKFNLENSWAALSCPLQDHHQQPEPDHVPFHIPSGRSGFWHQQDEGDRPRYNSRVAGFKRDVTKSFHIHVCPHPMARF